MSKVMQEPGVKIILRQKSEYYSKILILVLYGFYNLSVWVLTRSDLVQDIRNLDQDPPPPPQKKKKKLVQRYRSWITLGLYLDDLIRSDPSLNVD